MTWKKKAATAATFAVLTVTLVVMGVDAAHGAVKRPCYQAKVAFVNWPSVPSSFAYWRFVKGGKTLADGEFSFKGNLGGEYVRVIGRCLPVDPYTAGLSMDVKTERFAPCTPACHVLVALRRVR